ncbi:MAG TPA: phage/plasmid primase, P4 family [Pyrinomonadaceae bacterium]|nr:phage/plasmid primase, P4 family [Pyrinomonadaceae bacterium]
MSLTSALSAEHYEELIVSSCIDPETALNRGYRTLEDTGESRDLLESLGFRPYVWSREDAYPGLLIPMYGADGTVRGHQYKPAVPRKRRKEDGTSVPVKYETPSKAPNVVDVPTYTRTVLTDPAVPLWITEGMKKVDCLASRGLAALGLTGVFNWKAKNGVLGDWEEIPLKGRPVVVCFDSDAAGNRNVQLAMSRLGAWLRSRGVSTVHYLVVPAQVDGTEVKGVDDFFAAGGTLEVLHAAATQTAPGAGEKDAAFTDAFLVEELAEALDGQYCWASGLGWLRWNGRLWKDVSDVEPLEAVRVWASEQFDKTLSEQQKDRSKNMAGAIQGWRAILGKSRLTALRDLARGLLQKDAADFDGDPDLLTCKNGTVHLPTGRLLPFDPEQLITKSADADYLPGFTHPLWSKSLHAIPEDMREWYRDRLGQALTGYPVPDHVLVISHGSGANGKSTVVNTVRRTLGDYGVLVSDRVLMASPDAHPTELMDFRGARYAVLEETPEARHLNVQRLKTTIGTESIKARRIRQDPVEFLASHSLFINTNYRPVVTETDHGTWRRLSLMPWPFTFRKPGAALTGPWDREGDPALAYAANEPQVRAAALAWMVEGARAWYARGRMMLPVPDRIERETRDWRAETDLIMGFADDRLRFTPEAVTPAQELLNAFNEWAGDRGHRPWNNTTFGTRFGSHDMVKGAKVTQGRFSVNKKQVRGWAGVELRNEGRDPWTGEVIEPPAPNPCGNTPGDGPACDWDPECKDHFPAPAPVVELRIPAEPGPMPEPPAEPVAIGFDLETADADQLFLGGHGGPFVRLGGVHDGKHPDIVNPEVTGRLLAEADVIYGHNILGFDLLALAHHHGADYDALAAKAVDTLVLARLLDPPGAKGMQPWGSRGYYGLDQVAQRLGHEGKTDDLAALAKRYGGYDRILLDSREYQEYLRGDLAATKAVFEALRALVAEGSGAQVVYAEREMQVVALQNRMTLNGWAVDRELLAERMAHEDAQRAAAVQILRDEYGMPTHRPDTFKLLPKKDWPEHLRSIAITDARVMLRDRPEECVSQGMATRTQGEAYTSPWASEPGKEALVEAFAREGATTYPTTLKSGQLALSADALGSQPWYDKDRKKNMPGMLQIHGDKPGVVRIVETLAMATGARDKYAEIAKYVTPAGRVHAEISGTRPDDKNGTDQASGRWAMRHPSITNMGIRGAAGEERAVLVADSEDDVLLTCDASQVDMRAIAGLCQDPAYMELFQPGRDAHMDMAEVYFGERTKEARHRTKAINHKLNYGGAAESTAVMNNIPLEVVKQAVAERERAYPRLIGWTREVQERAASGALLDNGFGRLMRPDPQRAWTQGPALMGQGAARDIVCESLLRLVRFADEAGLNARPRLRGVVHDEVVLSVPRGEVEAWSDLLRRAFTWEWKGVPILCEVGTPAYRWSDCK